MVLNRFCWVAARVYLIAAVLLSVGTPECHRLFGYPQLLHLRIPCPSRVNSSGFIVASDTTSRELIFLVHIFHPLSYKKSRLVAGCLRRWFLNFTHSHISQQRVE